MTYVPNEQLHALIDWAEQAASFFQEAIHRPTNIGYFVNRPWAIKMVEAARAINLLPTSFFIPGWDLL